MIKQALGERIPSISASVGLFWSFFLAANGLTNPRISLGLAAVLAIAAIARPRIEIIGVALAATLALATITATPESFAVAGGSFVACLGAIAVAERRFRLSVFGFAVASVAVIAIAAPLVVDSGPVTDPDSQFEQSAALQIEDLRESVFDDFTDGLAPIDITEALVTPTPERGSELLFSD